MDNIRQHGLITSDFMNVKFRKIRGIWTNGVVYHLIHGKSVVYLRFHSFSRIDGDPIFIVYNYYLNGESLQDILNKPDSWITQDGIATKAYTNETIAVLIN